MSQSSSNTIQFVKCFCGIFVSYLIFGLIQESITKTRYGDTNEKFTFTLCLVFVQCICNAFFSKLYLTYGANEGVDRTPHWLYALCSLTYLGAMLASNESLQHVSYPTQVLGKSIKPVPVMILGVLLARKRYSFMKYICTLMIVLGVALFMYKDKSTTGRFSLKNQSLIGYGEILLVVSLGLDGLTGAIQDRMNAMFTTKTHSMMYSINIWSCLWLFFGVLFTGELMDFIIFAQKNPFIYAKLFLFSILGCIGQHFIFTTITTFSPLTCSIITTTRKFFTILGSVILFKNQMSGQQWLGVVLVFTGLCMDHKYGKEIKKKD